MVAKIIYKIGQLFGAAATFFIATWLVFHPEYEPNIAIRLFEIIGSYIAFLILCADVLDLHPKED